jgi:hypothetical protein
MVEQVARALCAARYNAPEGHYLPAFKQAQVEKHWQLFVDDASIAIEAMVKVVLAYRPKPKTKSARKRQRIRRKLAKK